MTSSVTYLMFKVMSGNFSVQLLLLFSHSVMSDSLQPHGLQHPGFPVHHHLLELVQTHVHRVSDAIQPSFTLLSPSPPAFSLSQHQHLFQWVGSSHQVAKVFIGDSASVSVIPMNIWGWFPLGLTGLILLFKGLSRIFSSTTVRKHQFFCAQLSLWSKAHNCTWLLEKL